MDVVVFPTPPLLIRYAYDFTHDFIEQTRIFRDGKIMVKTNIKQLL